MNIEGNVWLLIEVEGIPGEDNTKLTEVDPGTIEEITPLLLKIYDNRGWFPTGCFLYPGIIGSTPWEIYGEEVGEEAFSTLLSLMPGNNSGFLRISRVFCWEDEPRSLIM